MWYDVQLSRMAGDLVGCDNKPAGGKRVMLISL